MDTNKDKDNIKTVERINKKDSGKNIEYRGKMNTNILMIITFFTGVLLIVASYAWFSASLDVKIKFMDLKVSTDTGLFISLDAYDYSDIVEISVNSVISDLKEKYPNHTNQWAIGGLWPVSSIGIRDANHDKFDIFVGEVSRRRPKLNYKRFLNTRLYNEDNSSPLNSYIAFDVFLKNVSGSPKSDNLYFDEGTLVEYDETKEMADEDKQSMLNLMNSVRFGFVKIASVPHKTDPTIVQNLKCNANCEMVIYEPNSTNHSAESIESAKTYNITLVDGEYIPTYAIIAEGRDLDHTNGHVGTGIPLDTEHFKEQITRKDFTKKVYEIPNGITKLRMYIWIEGQDIDSLETRSRGAAIYLAINLIKDLAGYQDQ